MLRIVKENASELEIGHYIRRARAERELAIKAIGSGASAAHLQRAKYYEALVTRAHPVMRGCADATDWEVANFTMSSQRLFPFHQHRR